jgi:alpha-D-xyloside xylohydrolase
MNRQLHDMGFQTMISVWPRFERSPVTTISWQPERMVPTHCRWHAHDGLPYDRAGSDIDTTNPEAARWYWDIIRDNIISKGFDSIWADETEPDLPPNGAYFHVGPGTRTTTFIRCCTRPRSTMVSGAT